MLRGLCPAGVVKDLPSPLLVRSIFLPCPRLPLKARLLNQSNPLNLSSTLTPTPYQMFTTRSANVRNMPHLSKCCAYKSGADILCENIEGDCCVDCTRNRTESVRRSLLRGRVDNNRTGLQSRIRTITTQLSVLITHMLPKQRVRSLRRTTI